MPDQLWLSVDPGETTGWALWEGDQLLKADQAPLVRFEDYLGDSLGVGYCAQPEPLEPMFMQPDGRVPSLIVYERFALYPWKASDLDFDEMRTSQLIGAIRWIARQAGVRAVDQPATIKEPALEGGARELFLHPLYENRHANDAIMHGWYYIAVEMRGVKIKLPSAELLVLDPDEAYSLRGSGDGEA